MSYRIPPSMDDADSCLPLGVARWFVVRTLPRQERRAQASFREIQIRTYLPQETVWFRPSPGKEREPRQAALFAGYLFVQMRDEDLHKIRNEHGALLEGVLDFVRTSGQPRSINGEGVRRLHWIAYLESQREYDTTWSAKPERWAPRKGDRARVTGGHFTGHSGPIKQLRGKNRAEVMLTLFGMTKPYDVPISQLEAA